MLYLHAHYFYLVHYQFGRPFQHDGHVQYKVEVERLGIVCDRYDLISPKAVLA
jgi:hypothetical protein